jgi:protease-4
MKRTFLIIVLFIALIIGFIIFYNSQSDRLGPYEKRIQDWHKIDRVGESQIAVVPIHGAIRESSSFLSRSKENASAENISQLLYRIREDASIKVVILDINSPGGSAYDSEVISVAVDDLRDSGKTVYALLGSAAASGGYYIASQAEKIFASRLTMTGSIGVIMQIPNFSGIIDKYGISMITITTGKNKGIGSQFKPMTQEHEEILQNLANETYHLFIDRVVKGRNMSPEKVTSLADGRPYYGAEALEKGLIDSIGGKEALRTEIEGLGLNADVLVWYYPKKNKGLLKSLDFLSQSALELRGLLSSQSTVSIQY